MTDIMEDQVALNWQMLRSSALYKDYHDVIREKVKIVEAILPPGNAIWIPSVEQRVSDKTINLDGNGQKRKHAESYTLLVKKRSKNGLSTTTADAVAAAAAATTTAANNNTVGNSSSSRHGSSTRSNTLTSSNNTHSNNTQSNGSSRSNTPTSRNTFTSIISIFNSSNSTTCIIGQTCVITVTRTSWRLQNGGTSSYQNLGDPRWRHFRSKIAALNYSGTCPAVSVAVANRFRR
ncbi:putative uncharacterized protein DDB_G0285119 [Haliotis cracherodii]|uniref:putative uncharacterized protein DDB_G0285119 n=1 Tax=Haliotis cracherodii TaxID=6455 RepID=UPI0039E929EA